MLGYFILLFSFSFLVPLCHHGIPSICRVVKKAGKNHGRSFYCCPHDYSSSCGFFLWKDNNRNDVISLISSLQAKQQSVPQPTNITVKLQQFIEEELQKLTVENLHGIARKMQCKWKTNKAEVSQEIVKRTLALYNELNEWKKEYNSTEDEEKKKEIIATIAFEVFGIEEVRSDQFKVMEKVCKKDDTVSTSFNNSLIVIYCSYWKW